MEELLLQVGDKVMPQVKELRYLGILFMNERKMEKEINRMIGVLSAVMQALYWSW